MVLRVCWVVHVQSTLSITMRQKCLLEPVDELSRRLVVCTYQVIIRRCELVRFQARFSLLAS